MCTSGTPGCGSRLALMAIAAFGLLPFGSAQAEANPTLICRNKPWTAQAGEDSLLVTAGHEGYALTFQPQIEVTKRGLAKPKARGFTKLKCTFHPSQPAVFYCIDRKQTMGFALSKLTQVRINEELKPEQQESYKFELLANPAGDVEVVQELSFPVKACQSKP
ncbi:MAG: hypothetical protein IPG96_06980 [Proteobacteria bacterium]|nr:hypothetical protein [Pseudomonadota bacterium]